MLNYWSKALLFIVLGSTNYEVFRVCELETGTILFLCELYRYYFLCSFWWVLSWTFGSSLSPSPSLSHTQTPSDQYSKTQGHPQLNSRVHYEMITIISLVIIHSHMKLLQYFPIFPWLYIASQWLTYFTTASLYLIISFIYFTSLPTHTHSDNHQIHFCIYSCVFVLFICLYCFLVLIYMK